MNTARVPINGPFFFYFRVLRFRIRSAIIYGGYFGAFVVVSNGPMRERTTRTNACTTRAIFVGGQLFYRFVSYHRVVFRTLTTVVTTSDFIPFVARTKGSTAVQNGSSVIVDYRGLRIPTVAPRLAGKTL